MVKKILTFLGILYSSILTCQTLENKEFYNKIDKELSIGNLILENGKIYINKDITAKNSHRYLFDDITYTSNIKYNDQLYFDNNIKYDIYQNTLIINPSNQSKRLFIELDKNAVEFFTIKNKKFVLVNLPNNDKWYCEENLITPSFIFYVKYQKKKKDIISDNVIKIDYNEELSFYIEKKGIVTKIDSKKNILDLFPEFKTEINDYFKMNNHLKKHESLKFMENLFFKIKSLQK